MKPVDLVITFGFSMLTFVVGFFIGLAESYRVARKLIREEKERYNEGVRNPNPRS